MMKLLPFLFSLVIVPRWAFSDLQLVPTGPGMVRPGEDLSMVCKVTGLSITSSSSYAWYWIRQPSGKSFEAIAGINANTGGTWYAPSLKSRTVISTDTSKNEFSLLLKSLTPADSAVYFCAREHSETNPMGPVYKKRMQFH
ncbi:immunoglobulin heavy variable 4-38-2 [Anolis carolinensis]